MSQPIRARSAFRPGQVVQIVGTREVAVIISAETAERLGSQYAHDAANWDSALVQLPSGEVSLWYSGSLVVYEPPADFLHADDLPSFDAAVIALVIVGLSVLVWVVALWAGGYL